MKMTEKDMDYIAELARLELTPEEKTLYAGQLAGIFGWMEELDKAGTASVTPTANVPGPENAPREDTPVPFEAAKPSSGTPLNGNTILLR